MPETNEINEVRYYLEFMKSIMTVPTVEIATADVSAIDGAETERLEPFKPTYLVTAVKLPSGAIELAVNNTGIAEKIDYILEAYDENMHLKSNPEIVMQQLMVV